MSDGTRLVYLLWTHGEHGPENLIATLDADVLRTLIGERCDADRVPELVGRLQRNEVGVMSMQFGWGGWHLQIAELV